MLYEKSCIAETSDGFLSSLFTTEVKTYSDYNLLRLQGEVDALREIGCLTAVFEPRYLMEMVENFKEKLPNDFYLKMCALAKLYHEEKECMEKRITTMKKLLDEAVKPLNRKLFYEKEVMPPYILTAEEASASSSSARQLPMASLADNVVAGRRQQCNMIPTIRGGIRSFEIRFVQGVYPMHEAMLHCLCGKVLYGDWQNQLQEHHTSEVHATWVERFLTMNADQQLYHLNKEWEISIIGDNPIDAQRYTGIPRMNAWALHHKGHYLLGGVADDYEDEARQEAEEELQFRESGLNRSTWVGNEIVLIINPI